VIDDGEDRFVGAGSLVIEELHVVSGPEIYHLRVTHATQALAILWSPSGACLQLAPSPDHSCTKLGSTPIYLRIGGVEGLPSTKTPNTTP
jgi:hypothetical protein